MLKVSIERFSYEENEILKNVSFSLQKGEHLAVLGESGCGKTTLLHLVYGLLHLENGSIFWGKKQLLGPHFNLIPGEPFMKLVAQEYNVMPFITVAENIATHLSRRNMEADKKRVHELLEVVEMEAFSEIMVKTLSGGQKQRVALAKALAKEPEVLLLDEPFSNIDTFRKNALRRKLFNYLKEKRIACITATHDAEEALAFADKILMLKDGTVELYDRPKAVFGNLKTPYQAGFFGEVSVLPKGVFSSEEIVVLPHQLGVSVTETPLRVTIKHSFFKGGFYLIEAFMNNGDTVFFHYKEAIEKGSKYYVKLVDR
ncbi:MAG: ATP-binding cassette domain-containing protein [Flavobacteriaceae bacterium]